MPADDLDDDPVFARVRAARPAAPPSLAGDVLRRANPRPRRFAALAGAGLACAVFAVIAIVLVRRDPEAERAAAQESAPSRSGYSVQATADAAALRMTAPLDAAAAPVIIVDGAVIDMSGIEPLDWQHLKMIWFAIAMHESAIMACGKAEVAITVERARDGTAHAFHPLNGLGRRGPTPAEECRTRAVAAISLPAMPARLESAKFVVGVPIRDTDVDQLGGWADPVATLDEALARPTTATALQRCIPRPRTLVVVVDRRGYAERAWLPDYQFAADGAEGPGIRACLQRVLAPMTLPRLPKVVTELKISVPL